MGTVKVNPTLISGQRVDALHEVLHRRVVLGLCAELDAALLERALDECDVIQIVSILVPNA